MWYREDRYGRMADTHAPDIDEASRSSSVIVSQSSLVGLAGRSLVSAY